MADDSQTEFFWPTEPMHKPLVTNTERLFLLLLRVLRCDVVCDVGSMDCAHAKRCRQTLRKSRILAFEPNPANVQEIEQSEGWKDAKIELHPVAVTNTDGTNTFHIVTGPNARITDPQVWRGMSSLRRRVENTNEWWHGLPIQAEDTRTVRLDTVLVDIPGTVALWIDVEGVAYEALQGAGEVLKRVRLVHVEVETEPFWQNQKIDQHVTRFMHERGYALVARGPGASQRGPCLHSSRRCAPVLRSNCDTACNHPARTANVATSS